MNPQNLNAQRALQARIASVRDRIAAAAACAGRSVDSITLVAVSKGQPAEVVRAAAAAGLTQFGESYPQEALAKLEAFAKLEALAALPAPQDPDTSTRHAQIPPQPPVAPPAANALVWHFVGRLQANKTRAIAERFDWVHGIDRLRIAERLSQQRPYHAAPLSVCIQVNIADEASKGGVSVEELPELAAAVAALPRLRLRGLMCIPPEESEPARQRRWFGQLRGLLETLNTETLNTQEGLLDTLSMGMSGDLESAVLEGATCVRIGTALFGPRPDKALALPT